MQTTNLPSKRGVNQVQTTITRIPLNIKDLLNKEHGGLNIKDLFFYWFTEKPFLRTVISGKTGKPIPENRAILTKFSRVISYMKIFAPKGSLLL